MLLCVAVCCGVLRCVAVCCGVLRCVAACCGVLWCVAVCCGLFRSVAFCCVRVWSVALFFYAAFCCVHLRFFLRFDSFGFGLLRCVVFCFLLLRSVLRSFAVCCGLLLSVAVCWGQLWNCVLRLVGCMIGGCFSVCVSVVCGVSRCLVVFFGLLWCIGVLGVVLLSYAASGGRILYVVGCCAVLRLTG